jgi:hypothetical protein
MVIDHLGRISVTGWVLSFFSATAPPVDFGDGPLFIPGFGSTVVIAQLSPDGAALWSKALQPHHVDVPPLADGGASGTYVLGGRPQVLTVDDDNTLYLATRIGFADICGTFVDGQPYTWTVAVLKLRP